MTKNRLGLRDALIDSSEYLTNVLARCAYIEKNFYSANSQEKAEVGHAIVSTRWFYNMQQRCWLVKSPAWERWILDTATAITKQRLTELQSSVKEKEQYLHHWVELDQHLKHGENAKTVLAQIDGMSASLQASSQKFNLPIAEGAFYDSYMDQLINMRLCVLKDPN